MVSERDIITGETYHRYFGLVLLVHGYYRCVCVAIGDGSRRASKQANKQVSERASKQASSTRGVLACWWFVPLCTRIYRKKKKLQQQIPNAKSSNWTICGFRTLCTSTYRAARSQTHLIYLFLNRGSMLYLTSTTAVVILPTAATPVCTYSRSAETHVNKLQTTYAHLCCAGQHQHF